jgi:parallel beta-helix repeat protein
MEILHTLANKERLTMTRAVGVCTGFLLLTLGLHAVAQAQGCGQTVTGLLTLTVDLSCPAGHGLVVGSGATLDCAGHTITGGDQPGQYGIYVRNASNATVRNCTVEHFEIGIRLRQTTNGTVRDSVAQHNTAYGIDVTTSTAAQLQGNTVYNNGDEGIHVSGPADRDADHRIMGNKIDANAVEGIYLLGSHANTITGNTIQNHAQAGLYLTGSQRNTIEGNTLTNDPIYLVSGSQGNTLRDNTIKGERIRFHRAFTNDVYNMSIQTQGGKPSSAYEFIQASDNTIIDSEVINSIKYHIRAVSTSKNNVLTRFSVQPPLRCFVDSTSNVTVTDPHGDPLGWGNK